MRSTESEYGVRKKLFISPRFDFNETPRFPLYGERRYFMFSAFSTFFITLEVQSCNVRLICSYTP